MAQENAGPASPTHGLLDASRSPSRARSPGPQSWSREASNARLASPIPSFRNSPQMAPHSGRYELGNGSPAPLAGLSDEHHLRQERSTIASPLEHAGEDSPARGRGVLARADSASGSQENSQRRTAAGQSDAIGESPALEALEGRQSPAPLEDFDVVRRHLALPTNQSPSRTESGEQSVPQQPVPRRSSSQTEDLEENTSSLRLQGGDITREIYRRTQAESSGRNHHRSRTFNATRPEPDDEELDIENMRQPGGLRRNYIIRNQANHSPHPSQTGATPTVSSRTHQQQPQFVTRNFYEFLTLYGHFAGEEWDDEFAESETAADGGSEDEDEGGRSSERDPLLRKSNTRRRRQQQQENNLKTGATGTVFILLKSFVGTGVLFLPKAFLNGGMLFSFLVLFGVACLSYYCFVLLTTSRLKLRGQPAYSQMGEMMYGPKLRVLIQASLVISQVGFASAYIVFTSKNLQAFVLAVTKCKTEIDIVAVIFMQLVIFLPLSLYRNLNNISIVVYIADVCIVLGLSYLYYYDISTIVQHHSVADIINFNSKNWPTFIGTAIFTFEGIGLIIPIQDGMKKPEQLPVVLGGVVAIITVLFISIGALGYAAYGSKTQTVVLLNMPQDNKLVNAVQFFYSLAILLSTPMQIFPAITILESVVFKKSGKHNKNIKWLKNGFRFCLVIGCTLIAWVGANDLDKFVALVGSFACIPLVYIYPTLIHRKGAAESRLAKGIDLLLLVFGVCLMTYTSVLTVSSWIVRKEEKTPGYCVNGHPRKPPTML